jgi:FRG domain
MKYWDYYRDDFDWDDAMEHYQPDPATHSRFEALGYSDGEARRLVESGYVMLEGEDIVFDRYYAGLLSSTDGRVRTAAAHFRPEGYGQSAPVMVHVAASLAEVRRIVEAAQQRSMRRLLFRGQTRHFALARSVPNPTMSVTGLGEVSLVPSLWRRLLQVRPSSFLQFKNLSKIEWSKILYAQFDLEEIERRHQALLDAGEWVYSISEMEDCSDPLVAAFGKVRGDLLLEFDQHAPALATLLQHYGLFSPVLDLTGELDIALFFATHAFEGGGLESCYRFVGTNDRQAVLYLLKEDRETLTHQRRRLFEALDPQRPVKQHCVIAGAAPWAINLPADLLRAVIYLDFDLAEPPGLSTDQLFPGPSEDRFLKALIDQGIPHVTSFDRKTGLSNARGSRH